MMRVSSLLVGTIRNFGIGEIPKRIAIEFGKNQRFVANYCYSISTTTRKKARYGNFAKMPAGTVFEIEIPFHSNEIVKKKYSKRNSIPQPGQE